MLDVSEIEVRLKRLGVEPDGSLVERLRFDQFVAGVPDVREIDERGHEIRINDERPPVRGRRRFHVPFVPIVEA